MKKILLILALLLSLGSLSYGGVSDTLTSIEKELQVLESKEKERFKVEEKNAINSANRYKNYAKMISTSTDRVNNLKESESTALFPKENKVISKKYSNLVKLLEKEAMIEKKKVDEFNQLKKIMNY